MTKKQAENEIQYRLSIMILKQLVNENKISQEEFEEFRKKAGKKVYASCRLSGGEAMKKSVTTIQANSIKNSKTEKKKIISLPTAESQRNPMNN